MIGKREKEEFPSDHTSIHKGRHGYFFCLLEHVSSAHEHYKAKYSSFFSNTFDQSNRPRDVDNLGNIFKDWELDSDYGQ